MRINITYKAYLALLVFLATCPTDLVIRNGYANFSEDGKSLTYQCTANFKVIGSDSADCQFDGTWSFPPPNCSGMYLNDFLLVT